MNDSSFLQQVPDGESIPYKPPVSYDIRRFTLAPTAEQTIIFRQRWDYCRIAVIDTAPVAGDVVGVVVSAGMGIWLDSCVQLGEGGCIKIPMTDNYYTFRNIGAVGVTIVCIGIGGFDDDYNPGISLV